MSVRRQSRLKLKAKNRNVQATVVKSESKQQLIVPYTSEKQNDTATDIKKMRFCESSLSVPHANTLAKVASTSDNDDIVMISDDEDNFQKGTRQLHLKTEIVCSKSEDVSLINSFRKQLLQIRPAISKNKHLEDLPAFIHSHSDNTEEITVDNIASTADGELSPLPQMCSWCQRRKPIGLDGYTENTLNDSVFDVGPSVQTSKQIKSQLKMSQHVSDKINFSGDDPVNMFKTKKKNVLSDSKQFGPVVKPHCSKYDADDNSSVETSQRETTAEVVQTTTRHVVERGDNLFLRLSTKSRGYSAGNSESESSHVPFKRGENCPGVSSNRKQSAADNSWKQSNKPFSKEEVTLKSCPLCEMKFERGMSQLEIDGHIAACLASAEDDIMW